MSKGDGTWACYQAGRITKYLQQTCPFSVEGGGLLMKARSGEVSGQQLHAVPGVSLGLLGETALPLI